MQSKYVTDLRLYDLVYATGVGVDLSHMPVSTRVRGYEPGSIDKALKGADLVINVAGLARKPGMVREDLFNTNALTIEELTTEIAKHAPGAIIGVIPNPLNSMMVVAAETLKREKAYDPRKLFGIISLDAIRASVFLGEITGKDPKTLEVPILGGHSGRTMLPLLSIALGDEKITNDQQELITHRIRRGGDDVVKAKNGSGSCSLSMAFATLGWAEKVLRALDGEKGIVVSSIVDSPLMKPKLDLFGSPVELGREGVERVLPLPKMNAYEEEQLDRCLPDLEMNYRKGYEYFHTCKH
ncbi:malate dehydrogenase [Angomonas deanei]|nr:malate dehydrogenase [Angomonas deanei]|eukprot:EPY41561.1 malate dehydrogenase [Angomonas deanei]